MKRQALPSDDRLLTLLALRDKARRWECWNTVQDLNQRIAAEVARLEEEAA